MYHYNGIIIIGCIITELSIKLIIETDESNLNISDISNARKLHSQLLRKKVVKVR